MSCVGCSALDVELTFSAWLSEIGHSSIPYSRYLPSLLASRSLLSCVFYFLLSTFHFSPYPARAIIAVETGGNGCASGDTNPDCASICSYSAKV